VELGLHQQCCGQRRPQRKEWVEVSAIWESRELDVIERALPDSMINVSCVPVSFGRASDGSFHM
jgi:heterodisulfide reductase subunit B